MPERGARRRAASPDAARQALLEDGVLGVQGVVDAGHAAVGRQALGLELLERLLARACVCVCACVVCVLFCVRSTCCLCELVCGVFAAGMREGGGPAAPPCCAPQRQCLVLGGCLAGPCTLKA